MLDRHTATILEQCDCPEVKQRNYWLVRTDSGAHYDDFATNDYIAIGWDYITREMFERMSENEIKAIIQTQERVSPTKEDDEELSPDRSLSGRVTAVYNKLHRFICEFREGDIVLIPSKNTSRVSIGIITGPVEENPNYVADYLCANPSTELSLCPYKKRRSVSWIKGISKDRIDVYLVKAFSSHHAISDINDYADYINRELYSFYRTDDSIHSIIRAGHPNGMSLNELKSLIDILEGTFQEASRATGIPYDANQFQIKLNIHSPGIIEIVCGLAGCGGLLAVSMLAWNHVKNGGKLKFNMKIGNALEISAEAETLGIEGRRNEVKKMELDYQVQELNLSKGQRLRELSHTLEMEIPEINIKEDVLNIEFEDSVE